MLDLTWNDWCEIRQIKYARKIYLEKNLSHNSLNQLSENLTICTMLDLLNSAKTSLTLVIDLGGNSDTENKIDVANLCDNLWNKVEQFLIKKGKK